MRAFLSIEVRRICMHLIPLKALTHMANITSDLIRRSGYMFLALLGGNTYMEGKRVLHFHVLVLRHGRLLLAFVSSLATSQCIHT